MQGHFHTPVKQTGFFMRVLIALRLVKAPSQPVYQTGSAMETLKYNTGGSEWTHGRVTVYHTDGTKRTLHCQGKID